MTRPLTQALLTALLLAAGAQAALAQRSAPAQTVEAIGKVVDSLTAETAQRLTLDAYKGLPVVVRPATNTGVEPTLAELLRTRLVERGVAVEVACPARCLEITLVEFAVDATAAPGLSAGQILTVATGAVPILSGLTRTVSERERDTRGRTIGVLVTFSGRDGNRYTARQQLVAVIASAEERR